MKLISWWHHEEATYESGSLFCLDMVFVWVVCVYLLHYIKMAAPEDSGAAKFA